MSVNCIAQNSYIDYTSIWNNSENFLPSKVIKAVGALLINLGKVLANAALYCFYSLRDIVMLPLRPPLPDYVPLPDYMLDDPPPLPDYMMLDDPPLPDYMRDA